MCAAPACLAVVAISRIRTRACVAGWPRRIDEQQQGIGVAIDADFADAHHVAGCRAFAPQLAPAATPEMRLACALDLQHAIAAA